MGRSAILLIGTEKTGTTTLQHFLAANRPVLAERGFLYPSFCGAINHTGLAAYALAPEKIDPLRSSYGNDIPTLRARLEAAARAELTGPATVIFASEHCHSRLTTPAEIETLRRFLNGFFDEVRIAVYLRRQDQVALSLYSTRLKSGGTDPRILPRTAPDDPFFNYDTSLALWEEAFGHDAIAARLFDRKLLAGGSVVDDFVSTWNLGPIAGLHPGPRPERVDRPQGAGIPPPRQPRHRPSPRPPDRRGPRPPRRPPRRPLPRPRRPPRPRRRGGILRQVPRLERKPPPTFLPRPRAPSSTRTSPPIPRPRTPALSPPPTSPPSPQSSTCRRRRIRAASRRRSPSARRGCTGRGTSPRRRSGRCAGRPLVPRPRPGAPHPGRVPVPARPPAATRSLTAAPAAIAPGKLGVPAFPRHPSAPRRRLRAPPPRRRRVRWI